MLTSAQLTGRDLSHISEAHGKQMQPAVARAFAAMQQAAQQQGLEIAVASGFRSFERQLTIWNRKFQGDSILYNAHGDELVFSDLSIGEKIEAMLTWSALPGASRHHWGTELDVFDPREFEQSGKQLQLVAGEYAEGGPCYALHQWLQRHAAQYGFFFPYARFQGGVAAEPWHLSYRELAEPAQAAVTEELLATTIQENEVAGKDYVLARLYDIKQQYIDNICTDSGWSDVWCGYSSP